MTTQQRSTVTGDIDTTYMTQQRDMFESGLVAEIGVNAYAVWNAIKCHADFQTGVAWPGIRRLMTLTGLSTDPVQDAIKTLEASHLLRVTKHGNGRSSEYVARERMDVRVGNKVICTVAVDYVPMAMRERLEKLKMATRGVLAADDVWAEVELIPGPGMTLDATSATFKTNIRADDVPHQQTMEAALANPQVAQAREKLKQLSTEMKAGKKAPKK